MEGVKSDLSVPTDSPIVEEPGIPSKILEEGEKKMETESVVEDEEEDGEEDEEPDPLSSTVKDSKNRDTSAFASVIDEVENEIDRSPTPANRNIGSDSVVEESFANAPYKESAAKASVVFPNEHIPEDIHRQPAKSFPTGNTVKLVNPQKLHTNSVITTKSAATQNSQSKSITQRESASPPRPRSRIKATSAEEGGGFHPLIPIYSTLMEGVYERPVVVSILVPEKKQKKKAKSGAEKSGTAAGSDSNGNGMRSSVNSYDSFDGTPPENEMYLNWNAHDPPQSIPNDIPYVPTTPSPSSKQRPSATATTAATNNTAAVNNSSTPSPLMFHNHPHISKNLKYFIVKVNDLVTNKEAQHSVVLREYNQFFQELMDEFQQYEPTVIVEYYKPLEIYWWVKYLKHFLLIYNKPNAHLSVIVNKKFIKLFLKKKLDHHYWMKEQQYYQQHPTVQQQPPAAAVVVPPQQQEGYTNRVISATEYVQHEFPDYAKRSSSTSFVSSSAAGAAATLQESAQCDSPSSAGLASVFEDEPSAVVMDGEGKDTSKAAKKPPSSSSSTADHRKISSRQKTGPSHGHGGSQKKKERFQSTVSKSLPDIRAVKGEKTTATAAVVAVTQIPIVSPEGDEEIPTTALPLTEGVEGVKEQPSIESSLPNVSTHSQQSSLNTQHSAKSLFSATPGTAVEQPKTHQKHPPQPPPTSSSRATRDEKPLRPLGERTGELLLVAYGDDIPTKKITKLLEQEAEVAAQMNSKRKARGLQSVSISASTVNGGSSKQPNIRPYSMPPDHSYDSYDTINSNNQHQPEESTRITLPMSPLAIELPPLASLGPRSRSNSHNSDPWSPGRTSSSPPKSGRTSPTGRRTPSKSGLNAASFDELGNYNHPARPSSPFQRQTQHLKGSAKTAADIIHKARVQVFGDARFQLKKISLSERRLLESPFAKKLWVETEETKAILAKQAAAAIILKEKALGKHSPTKQNSPGKPSLLSVTSSPKSPGSPSKSFALQENISADDDAMMENAPAIVYEEGF